MLEWPDEQTVRLHSSLQAGDKVVIERDTPIVDQIVKFQNGAVLTEEDLNTAVQQLLFKQQEITGLYERSLLRARIRILEANSVPITPEDIALQIAAIAAENVLLDDFRSRISQIIGHDETIASQAIALGQTTQAVTNVALSNAQMVGDLNQLRLEHDTLSGVVDALANLEDGSGIATVIQYEADQRVSGDAALAATIGLIGAQVDNNSAFLLDLNRVRVTPTETLASRLTVINATNQALDARITTEHNAWVAGDAAEATARTTLGAALRGEFAAAITSEAEARADALGAEAAQRETLAANLRTDLSALIIEEQQARVTADQQFAAKMNLLGVQNGTGTAFILNEDQVLLSDGASFGYHLDGMTARIGTAEAGIANEAVVRASADSSISQKVTTVESSLNGTKASVTSLTQTVNGVMARYGVALNTNGYITGFVQNNDGKTGSFDILADKFRVTMPGYAPKTVFSVDANGVYINGNLRIDGNLIVDGTTPTEVLQPNAISVSAYALLGAGGDQASRPSNTWVDFTFGATTTTTNPATGTTTTTSTGGSGGGGGGGTGNLMNQV